MKFRILIFNLFAACTVSFAQTTYRGQVTDAVTANTISNAEVRLLHLPDSALAVQITDHSGQFEFAHVENGTYIVQIFHLSYEPVTVTRKGIAGMHEQFVLERLSELLEESVIIATRARDNSPTTFQNLSRKELNEKNYGQDMPYIINHTPSTVVSSDAGAGVGYTGIRMRGIDATRINVTINGFPYNDAESQGVYWVNMPDLASSVSSMQIQRGVGTSTNGSAAFGGSINIKTDHVNQDPFSRLDFSYGSYNTVKRAIQFGTGMLKNGWGFQGRYSSINSDGYIDRASSDLNSLYLTGKYLKKRDQFKFNIIRGHERTYQAWWGVPQTYFTDGKNNPEFIAAWAPSQAVAENMRTSDPKSFNYYTYKNQVDNYNQDHYQAFYTRQLMHSTYLNIGLNYTRGIGYYEEYQDDENYFDNTSLSYYRMDDVIHGQDTITTSDIIRRLWLDNHFIGSIFSVSHRTNKFNFILGGGYHNYRGLHYGDVVWARYASNSEVDHRFYKNNAQKRQGNLYFKLDNEPARRKWNYLVDLQVRTVDYQFEGPDRTGVQTDRTEQYLFFNPKAGISRITGKNGAGYFSVARSNREPVRKDFVYSTPASLPRPEQLTDIEAGYRIKKLRYQFNANLYFMEYKDQLVLTGQINDVGEATRQNVRSSYRRGVEMDGSYTFKGNKLIVGGNATLSLNKIRSYTEFVGSFDTTAPGIFTWENKEIAFSPGVIGMVYAQYEFIRKVKIHLQAKHVGRQYLDNTGSKDRSLDPFNVMDLHLDFRHTFKQGTGIEAGLAVNNLFGEVYVANGYTFPYMYGGERITDNYVYPQAPMNFLLRMAVTF